MKRNMMIGAVATGGAVVGAITAALVRRMASTSTAPAGAVLGPGSAAAYLTSMGLNCEAWRALGPNEKATALVNAGIASDPNIEGIVYSIEQFCAVPIYAFYFPYVPLYDYGYWGWGFEGRPTYPHGGGGGHGGWGGGSHGGGGHRGGGHGH